MNIVCPVCAKEVSKSNGEVNRARAIGAPLYCGKACSGVGRRKNKTKAQKVAEKAAYDTAYRAKNLELLKANKAAYFVRTYDPATAAEARKAKMPRHVEYCRQPQYKTWKSNYDKQYRAKKYFGAFWESFLLLQDIDREVGERMSDYDIRGLNGTRNKCKERRRAYDRLNSDQP